MNIIRWIINVDTRCNANLFATVNRFDYLKSNAVDEFSSLVEKKF
jgi:hypothetical protein